MSWANKVQRKYRRNGKIVDSETRNVLVEKMRVGMELEENQKKVFKELDSFFASIDSWEPKSSPIRDINIFTDAGNKIGAVKAEMNADVTAEEAAAWYFDYCSRERTRQGDGKDIARLEIEAQKKTVNEHLFANVIFSPFPLKPREFIFKQIWNRNDDGSMTVVWVPTNDTADYGGIGKTVQGFTKGIFTARNIESKGGEAERGAKDERSEATTVYYCSTITNNLPLVASLVAGVPQCAISLLQMYELRFGGFFAGTTKSKKIPRVIAELSSLSSAFKQDEKIDHADLTVLANIIKNVPQLYTEEEEEAIKRGKEVRGSEEQRTAGAKRQQQQRTAYPHY